MIRKYLSIAIFLCLCTMGNAQSVEEKEVAAAVEKLHKAMIDANKTGLESVAADNLSYGHSSGKVENKSEFVEALVSGKSDFVSISITDQTVKITDKTAVVRHVLKGETINNGTPGNISLSVVLVWIKQKADWKLLVRQAVKI
jgi:Domain of unknown function (DUF4440)